MPPRVVVALLTPLSAAGRLDEGALGEHAGWLCEQGVDGLMPCGTTGEGPLLESAEVEAVVRTTVEAAAGRVPVLAHVGRPATEATVELARAALAAGATAVSAVVPYYYALDEEAVARHYRVLLAAVEAPVYAYVIPARTGNDLSADLARGLAADGLAGVKDSTKSWERHLEFIETGVEVLVGTDALVRDAFAAGAAGCVSALANVRPDLLCALRDGGGAEVQEDILALRGELPFPRLKAALADELDGYPSAYRAPLR